MICKLLQCIKWFFFAKMKMKRAVHDELNNSRTWWRMDRWLVAAALPKCGQSMSVVQSYHHQKKWNGHRQVCSVHGSAGWYRETSALEGLRKLCRFLHATRPSLWAAQAPSNLLSQPRVYHAKELGLPWCAIFSGGTFLISRLKLWKSHNEYH